MASGSRRIVISPQDSTSRGKKRKTPPRINRKPSSSGAPQGTLKSLTAKCCMLLGDLETSSISIDELVAEGVLTDSAIDMEITEVQEMVDEYSHTHLALLRKCEMEGVDVQEHEDRRRRFLIRSKSIRNQLLTQRKALNKKAETSGLVSSGLKLPRVEIPTFEGDFEQWSSWYKLFESLIHRNNGLDNMEKFSFLQSRLKGVPLTLIDGFPFEGEYYEAAFSAIVAHYDDPLKQISRLLDVIQSAPPMKEKKQNLRGLITLFRANVTSLQVTLSQNSEVDPLSQVLIHTFLAKADRGTRQDWEREMTRRKRFASFDEFIEYMEGRCNAFERATGTNSNPSQPEAPPKGRSSKVLSIGARKRRCYYCGLDHTVYKCQEFRKLALAERRKAVAEKGLCQKCLSPRCNKKCPIVCGNCKGGHNILLHESKDSNSSSKQTGEQSFSSYFSKNKASEIDSSTPILSNKWIGSTLSSISEALLATTQLQVSNSNSCNFFSTRAVLDSASQLNLITTNLAKTLNLQPFFSDVRISSVNHRLTPTEGCVILKISSKHTSFIATICCEIVEEIVDLVPSQSFDIEGWPIPKNISLADSRFNISSNIDLLLGIQIFWKTLGSKTIDLGKNLPCLRSSQFGWLVTDNRDLEGPNSTSLKYNLATQIQDTLSETFQRFWFLDEFDSKTLSFEELECERTFQETTIRNSQGRFIV